MGHKRDGSTSGIRTQAGWNSGGSEHRRDRKTSGIGKQAESENKRDRNTGVMGTPGGENVFAFRG